jgi:hypothetical protein
MSSLLQCLVDIEQLVEKQVAQSGDYSLFIHNMDQKLKETRQGSLLA